MKAIKLIGADEFIGFPEPVKSSRRTYTVVFEFEDGTTDWDIVSATSDEEAETLAGAYGFKVVSITAGAGVAAAMIGKDI